MDECRGEGEGMTATRPLVRGECTIKQPQFESFVPLTTTTLRKHSHQDTQTYQLRDGLQLVARKHLCV